MIRYWSTFLGIVMLFQLSCGLKKHNNGQKELDSELNAAYRDKDLLKQIEKQKLLDAQKGNMGKDEEEKKNNDNSYGDGVKYWVDVTSVLRVRDRAGTNGSKIIGSLASKQEVVLIESGKLTQNIAGVSGTWVKVKASDGLMGWVFGGFLKQVKGSGGDKTGLELSLKKEEVKDNQGLFLGNWSLSGTLRKKDTYIKVLKNSTFSANLRGPMGSPFKLNGNWRLSTNKICFLPREGLIGLGKGKKSCFWLVSKKLITDSAHAGEFVNLQTSAPISGFRKAN